MEAFLFNSLIVLCRTSSKMQKSNDKSAILVLAQTFIHFLFSLLEFSVLGLSRISISVDVLCTGQCHPTFL